MEYACLRPFTILLFLLHPYFGRGRDHRMTLRSSFLCWVETVKLTTIDLGQEHAPLFKRTSHDTHKINA
jgi:hypothetical protein